MFRSARHLARDERGAAMIEFALIVSMLIVLVFGSLQIGRALMARNAMSRAVSETVRIVHLDPTTTSAEVVAELEERLGGIAGQELDVAITEIAGTSYMRINVSFPYRIWIPLLPEREVTMQVETLAPMVSPTQASG